VDEAKFLEWFDPLETKAKILWEQYHDEMKVRRRMPKEMFVIDGLSPAIQEKLDTTAESLFFSADGVAKQVLHHPEVKEAEYVGVLNKINDCKKIDRTDEYHVAIIVVNKRRYKVVLKTDKKRSLVYLVSLFRFE
jgi:DNA polymerase III delta prime subunit